MHRPRLSAHKRGYDRQWARYSKAYRKANPWCVKCLPKLTPAQCVDHIIPAQGKDDPDFYNPDNHQPLCHQCHSIKTAQEDGGFGNRHGKPKVQIGEDGWPVS